MHTWCFSCKKTVQPVAISIPTVFIKRYVATDPATMQGYVQELPVSSNEDVAVCPSCRKRIPNKNLGMATPTDIMFISNKKVAIFAGVFAVLGYVFGGYLGLEGIGVGLAAIVAFYSVRIVENF